MQADEYVPERNWRERTYPVPFIRGVPKDIIHQYILIKRKYGVELANLIVFAYRTWGKRVARSLANKILSFDSFEDVIRFLEKKATLFDVESRKRIANIIYTFRYGYYFDRVVELSRAKESSCKGVWHYSVKLFHFLARRGIFLHPECIVSYSMEKLGCVDKIPPRCRVVEDVVAKVMSSDEAFA